MTRETRAAAAAGARRARPARRLGARRFKNVAEPVELFALRAPADGQRRARGRPGLPDAARPRAGRGERSCTAASSSASARRAAPSASGARPSATWAAAPTGSTCGSPMPRASASRCGSGAPTASGRLDAGELEARLARTYAAAVRADLAAVTRDLPAPPSPPRPGPLGAAVDACGGRPRRRCAAGCGRAAGAAERRRAPSAQTGTTPWRFHGRSTACPRPSPARGRSPGASRAGR